MYRLYSRPLSLLGFGIRCGLAGCVLQCYFGQPTELERVNSKLRHAISVTL